MTDRDARRPEVRLTPPPRISAVGKKRRAREDAEGRAAGTIAPTHRPGRPSWAAPVAFLLLALVAAAGVLLILRQAAPSTEVQERVAEAGGGAPTGAVPTEPLSETSARTAAQPGEARPAEPAPAVSEPPRAAESRVAGPNARADASPAAVNDRRPVELRQPPDELEQTRDERGSARGSERSGGVEFGRQLAIALAAIEAADWSAAGAALDRAEAERPGSSEVAEARARVAAIMAASVLEGHLVRADEALGSERWRDASRELEAVLSIDPTLTRARLGLQISEGRAEMAEMLDYHLAHPDRLATAEVLAEAEELLEEASQVADPGPRHLRQTSQLRDLLSTARVPIPVSLRSDGQTEVTVYRVGRLGTFTQRELELRPGLYTVVGSRRGYRDVRHQLRVRAGTPPEPLMVRCEEKI